MAVRSFKDSTSAEMKHCRRRVKQVQKSVQEEKSAIVWTADVEGSAQGTARGAGGLNCIKLLLARSEFIRIWSSTSDTDAREDTNDLLV